VNEVILCVRQKYQGTIYNTVWLTRILRMAFNTAGSKRMCSLSMSHASLINCNFVRKNIGQEMTAGLRQDN